LQTLFKRVQIITVIYEYRQDRAVASPAQLGGAKKNSGVAKYLLSFLKFEVKITLKHGPRKKQKH